MEAVETKSLTALDLSPFIGCKFKSNHYIDREGILQGITMFSGVEACKVIWNGSSIIGHSYPHNIKPFLTPVDQMTEEDAFCVAEHVWPQNKDGEYEYSAWKKDEDWMVGLVIHGRSHSDICITDMWGIEVRALNKLRELGYDTDGWIGRGLAIKKSDGENTNGTR